MRLVLETAQGEFPHLALTPDGGASLGMAGSCQQGRRVCSVTSGTSVSFLLQELTPALVPQIGVTEAGLQRAILERVQKILAVTKTIPGTTSSSLSGL